MEVQASMPQVELTGDVWDLNNDQLQEALEALQIKMALREGEAPTGVTSGKSRAPGGSGEPLTDDREVDPRRERGWQYGKPVPWLISPPQLTSDVGCLLSTLTARLRIGTPISIPLVVMPPPERPKYLSNSGISRSGVSRTTTQKWWSRKVLSGC